MTCSTPVEDLPAEGTVAVGGKLFDAKLKDRNGVIADAICRNIALE